MTVLAVTGATGFLGRALCEGAIRSGYRLRAITVSGRAAPPVMHNIHSVEIPNIHDGEAMARALEGVSAIVHLAGRAHRRETSPETDQRLHDAINHQYAVALARAAVLAGVPKMVQASTIAVYGQRSASAALTEDTPVNPATPYGRAKLAAETELRDIALQNEGFSVTALRLPLIAGAKAPGNLNALFKAVVRGMPLPLGSANKNQRSLVSVRDAADAFLLAARDSRPGFHLYCLADPQPVSTMDIIDGIAQGAGQKTLTIPVPAALCRLGLGVLGKGALGDQLFGSLTVDPARFMKDTGWIPSHGLKAALWELGQSTLCEVAEQRGAGLGAAI